MTLTAKLLIVAMAAQVLLTIAILVLMGRQRVPMVMSGQMPVEKIAVDKEPWPLRAKLLSNNFDNQFQLPVLFYAAILLALITGGIGWIDVVLAWLFVVLRYVHAAIHVSTNRVYRRFTAYTAGLAVLCLLWLWLLLRLVVLTPSI